MNHTQRSTKNSSPERSRISLRKPVAADGHTVAQLIAACPPLDQNSVYCNLLQCADFADTCILAERDNQAVGWISGYRPPARPDTLFVWQVAVHADARGCGLAGRMLDDLLSRPDCDAVEQLQTTITADNEGSFALFRSFAKRAGAQFNEAPGFDKTIHFHGEHDSERLITIGPLANKASMQSGSRSAA